MRKPDLATWRKSYELRQTEAAGCFGVPLRTYQRWESQGVPKYLWTIVATSMKVFGAQLKATQP